jgi:hypothetical protein
MRLFVRLFRLWGDEVVGRRPVIRLGRTFLAAVFCSYSFVGHHVFVGLGLT